MTATLFDMKRLTPYEVARQQGVHPVTRLALDPDEARSCGNCANRRDVWVYATEDVKSCRTADRWEQVCMLSAPPCSRPLRLSIGWPGEDERILEGDYHGSGWSYPDEGDDGCCNASCCDHHAAEARREGYDPEPPWPWPSRIRKEPLPACVKWADLEGEKVLAVLARGRA